MTGNGWWLETPAIFVLGYNIAASMDRNGSEIKDLFPGKRIVIIGDLVADQFLHGTISRVSREAPVFILRHDTTVTVPGAAANTAANLASLGATPYLIGVVGDDPNGRGLLDALTKLGVSGEGILVDEKFSTTTKVRVLAGQNYAARQQVIRIDYEDRSPLKTGTKELLRQRLSALASGADAIIVSDYDRGAVFAEIFADAVVISRERGIPLIVDSRYRLAEMAGGTTATPNREEAEQILGPDFTDNDCSALLSRLGYEALLVTNGNQGMRLFQRDVPPLNIEAVGSLEPVDVTGAGDTVIAAYCLGLAAGLSHADAAWIANHAGGLVVMKKGTATVSADELSESLRGQKDLSARSVS